MNVTLLVSGSIAAYKAAEIVRALKKKGANVQVAMSPSASKFITSLTLQTLSGNRVISDLFDEESEAEISHISIADSADVVLLAPATANVIAKAALGLADDIIGTTLLATKARVIVAPAMNVNMWQNQVTKENVAKLKARGLEFVEPCEGELACGWHGEGRLAEIDEIVGAVFREHSSELAGRHVIVSAGPTREPIDPIRFISNRSSGKMGYALAKVAAQKGAKVSLVSGPVALDPPSGVDLYKVNTAEEMNEKLRTLLSSSSYERCFLYMAAAVSDHRPKFTSTSKLKDFKNKDFELALAASADILADIGRDKERLHKNLTIIGFAAETAENEAQLEEFARKKLSSKYANFIVANNAGDSFEKETNSVIVVSETETKRFEQASKDVIAKNIIEVSTKSHVD